MATLLSNEAQTGTLQNHFIIAAGYIIGRLSAAVLKLNSEHKCTLRPYQVSSINII